MEAKKASVNYAVVQASASTGNAKRNVDHVEEVVFAGMTQEK
jgi:hypothetical protein